ncbi:MAG: hypothetical protein QM611_00985, partial [Microbacterium sp.]
MPFDQSRYQVRFEWGADGLARLAPADIVVVVDVLGLSTTATDAASRGEPVEAPAEAPAPAFEPAPAPAAGPAPAPAAGPAPEPVEGPPTPANGAEVVAAAAASGALVLAGCLRNASAVAGAVLAEQARRAARTSVAVVAV